MLAKHVIKCAKKDEVIQLEPVSDETKALFKTQVSKVMKNLMNLNLNFLLNLGFGYYGKR